MNLKRALIGISAFIALLLLLMVALVLLRNPLLRPLAETLMETETGLHARIESLEIGLASPSLQIRQFTLAHPPGFGEGSFLHVPELYLKLDPARSMENRIAFEEIRFHLASLNVVRNLAGQYNFDCLTNSPSARSSERKGNSNEAVEFGGIGTLSLTVDRLTYTDLAFPENNLTINVDLTAETTLLRDAEDLTNWFGGLITRVAIEQYFKQRHQPFWKQLLVGND